MRKINDISWKVLDFIGTFLEEFMPTVFVAFFLSLAILFLFLCASLFQIGVAPQRTACVKDNGNVLFVETIITQAGGDTIGYKVNGQTYYSNNFTYVYANESASCQKIFPVIIK